MPQPRSMTLAVEALRRRPSLATAAGSSSSSSSSLELSSPACELRNSSILASASESSNHTVPSSAGLDAWLVSSVV